MSILFRKQISECNEHQVKFMESHHKKSSLKRELLNINEEIFKRKFVTLG
jgi:hypothetical protein